MAPRDFLWYHGGMFRKLFLCMLPVASLGLSEARAESLYCRRWYIEEHRAVTSGKGPWSVDAPTPPWQWAR
ncbi:MAG: hypothetical protein J5838_01505 [Desulfovibrio sp.]|nr:hypothetical protein [Desulfovibrio sp.]